MRKLIYGLLGLIALLLAGVVVFVMTADLNSYKPEIEAQLEAATGRDVMIGGDIAFTLLPSLAITVDDIRIAGVEAGSGEPLASLPRVQAVVALVPLLSGEIEIERVRLVEPVVILERADDGSASWELTPAANGGGGDTAVSIARFEVENGTVLWRDAAGEQRISGLTLTASAHSLEGPFEATGNFARESVVWSFSADIGRTSRPQVPINLSLASDAGKATLAGSVDLGGAAPAFSGQVQAEGDRLGPALALAGIDDATLPPALAAMPWSLDTGLSASAEVVRVADGALGLGEMRLLGGGELLLGARPSLDLVLSANRIDLDVLLAGVPDGTPEEGDRPPLALPAGLDATVDLAAEAVIWHGAAVRQAHVIAALAEGALTLSQATAQLPGGTDVALGGTVAQEDGVLTFRGPLEANSDDLRATLDWLGVDLGTVPADRLRRVDASASAVLQPGIVALSGIDLRFDSSRLTGAIAARTEATPTVTADVVLDRINLDAYLAPAAGPSSSEDTSGFAMPALPDLNLDLKARVDQLTYNGILVTGVVADGKLFEGKLDLATLGVADVAGASLRTSGTVDPAAGTIDLKLGVQADDAGGLLRLIGIRLPIDPARLGHVDLVGEVTGGTDQAVIRQRLDTGLGQASIDGTLLDVLGAPGFDGRIGLHATSYRTLAAALDIALPEADDSEIAFAADVTTDGHKADVNAVLELLGLTARASGNATDLQGTPAFDLRLVAEHGELGDLLAALGAGGGGDLGPLKLSLSAKGDPAHVDLTLAPSTIGASDLHGSGALDFSGARPKVTASLQAGVLELDPFLAASSGGTLGDQDTAADGSADGSAAPEGRWSAEPIDLSGLHGIDGHIELVADEARLQGMSFGRPTMVVTLADDTLTIERFDGTLYGGQFSATGTVRPGVPHQMSFDLALANADARDLLMHFADSDRISGRLFLDAKLTTVGLSQRDLVQALAGTGALTLREGVVQGFDLAAINQRLGNLNDELAIAGLLAQASSGGETKILAADGTFRMSDGIARSDDLKVVLDGGSATFTMTADLPRWWIDLAGEAALTGHAEAPTIPITVRGPIDAPTRTVDTSALKAFLVQRAAATAINKLGGDTGGAAGTVLDLLSGGSGQSSGSTEPAQPAQDSGQSDGGTAGSLLDVLNGSSGQAEPAPEDGNQKLDTNELLQDLLQNLGN